MDLIGIFERFYFIKFLLDDCKKKIFKLTSLFYYYGMQADNERS